MDANRVVTIAAKQLAARAAAHRQAGLASRRRRVPRSRPPRLIESDYAARLVAAVVGRIREAIDGVLSGLLHGLRADGMRLDEHETARTVRVINGIREATEPAIEDVARDAGRRVAAHQRGELTRQTRAALGIEPVILDPAIPRTIEGFAHENAQLIRSLHGRTLDQIEAIIIRAHTSGTRAEATAAEIEARYGVAERHARLIARDQIGKLNGSVTALRHEELGIASFVWRDAGDSRVRPRHRDLNGKRFRYDKPPAEGLPGHPIACRCTQEPVFDEILALI